MKNHQTTLNNTKIYKTYKTIWHAALLLALTAGMRGIGHGHWQYQKTWRRPRIGFTDWTRVCGWTQVGWWCLVDMIWKGFADRRFFCWHLQVTSGYCMLLSCHSHLWPSQTSSRAAWGCRASYGRFQSPWGRVEMGWVGSRGLWVIAVGCSRY